MIHKRTLHHWLVILGRLRVWQLVIITILLAALSAYLLRQNNLHMVELRNAVQDADGANININGALLNLQHYVTAHMNTNLGSGVFLEKSYERDYQAQLQAAANATNPNAVLYAQIEKECRPLRAQGGYLPYTQCAHDKLSTVAGNDAFAAVQPPAVALYTYNFLSPMWSADFAGLAIVATLILLSIMALRLLGYVALRALLRVRH